MRSVSNPGSQTNLAPPYLKILDPGRQLSTFALADGTSILVGSGTLCGLNLAGDDQVMPVHCMVRAEDGQLWVHDWNTDGKTLHNGQPVQSEATLSSGDELEIGRFRLIPVLDLDVHQSHSFEAEVQPPQPAECSFPASGPGTQDGDNHPPEADDNEHANTPAAIESSVLDSDQTEFQFSVIEQKLRLIEESYEQPESAEDGWLDVEQQAWDNPPDDNGEAEYSTPEQEEIGLLREEIAQLQSELADRDTQIIELGETFSCDSPTADTEPETSLSPEEAAKLIGRLEELLEELDAADLRIATLEDLLRMSDEANRAEQEERQQLETWVEQIEKVVSQREMESRAELARINRRLEQVTAERDQAEQQLQGASPQSESGHSAAQPARELIGQLRRETDSLQNSLQRSEQENQKLRQQLDELLASSEHPQSVPELQQTIRDLELTASRERAEFARQRVELARLQEEMERQSAAKPSSNDADRRVRAMRQHLREIHEEEKQELEQQRQQRGLGGRITRLWQRLENR